MTASAIVEFNQVVPAVQMRWALSVVVMIVSASMGTLTSVALAITIGYPVPFTVVTASLGFMLPFVSLVLAHVGRYGVRKHLNELRLLALLLTIQFTQTLVYPAFTFALGNFKPQHQPYFVLVLSVIKIVNKIALANVMDTRPDLKPVFIVLNAELFHALFVSISMKSSPSGITTAFITGIDVAVSCHTLYQIRGRIKELQQLLSRGISTCERPTSKSLPPLVESAVWLLQDKFVLDAIQSATRARILITQQASLAIVPVQVKGSAATAQSIPSVSLPQLTSDEQTELRNLASHDKIAFSFVEQTLELPHKTQKMLLTEYVEVVAPLAFAFFFLVGSQLPNHVFCRLFQDSSENANAQVTSSILFYAVLEFATFLPLDWILSNYIGFHPVHQLTFWLRQEWLLIQSELALWLLFTQQTALDHYGFDFSFLLSWLHHQDGSF